MNVDFYYIVPNKRHNGVIYNEGIAALSAIAKRHGAAVSLQRIDLADYRARNFTINADVSLHAVSYASGQHLLAVQVIKAIREACPNGIIAVGGIHATVARQGVIDIQEVDVVVSGEGERPFEMLMTQGMEGLRKAMLPNVYVRGELLRPLSKTDFVDVNSLEFPDRTIFERARLARAPEFIFSRGCPHSCAYCANSFLNEHFGCRIRRKSPEYCIQEILNAKALLCFDNDVTLTFHDDIFLTDQEWLLNFAKLYKSTFSNPFRCNTTAKAVTEANVKILKEINCTELWIGIETGNEILRRNVLHKHVSNETILRAFHIANSAGLKTVSFMMIGIPGETYESIVDSMLLNRACNIYSTSIAHFHPFPGTPAYEIAKQNGTIRPLTAEELDLGVGVFGLKEATLTHTELDYYAALLYSYSKRNIPQELYLRLMKPFLTSKTFARVSWGVYYRVINRLFPEKNSIIFVRSD